MRRGRIGTYALWQWRDYLMDRGLPTILILTLFGYLGIASTLSSLERNIANLTPKAIAGYGGLEAARAALTADVTQMFLRGTLGSLIYIGAVLAMNGIVANDRKAGFYRFLFAKPITATRYYGQAFLIHWASYVAIASALSLVYGWLVGPMFSIPLLMTITLMFLLYAGIVFLMSAATRGDWVLLVVVTVSASYAWEKFGASTSIFAKLLYVLPPLHRTTEIYAAAAKMESPDGRLLAWFGLYGLACYVAGLVVLRYRRMAIA